MGKKGPTSAYENKKIFEINHFLVQNDEIEKKTHYFNPKSFILNGVATSVGGGGSLLALLLNSCV